jgi:anti-sigma factor RsiW
MNQERMDKFFYAAPADLRSRISETIRSEAAIVPTPVRPVRQRLFYAMAGVAWAASLLLVGRYSTMETGGDRQLQEVVASHVRSMMAEHLADVPSSDRHTVKPWFNGKLDFSPHVDDFASEGFPLVGGRLDYVSGRPVAALVYRRGQHVINLFTWPSPDAVARPPRLISQQGYQIFQWSKDGMQYWLISDLNASDLQTLEERLRM